MDAQVKTDRDEPITFANAPTHVIDGLHYVDDAAAIELGSRVAKRYEALLARLADE